MIELNGIRKSFGKTEVLKGIDLSVSRGEVVALIGSSGTGKTTLLRCINWLEKPCAGSVRVSGTTVDVRHPAKKDVLALRRKTAMVFQHYNLFKNKTVLENVTEGLVVVQKKSASEARRIATEELEKVGLSDKLNAWPSVLSGGQQQRVGIARAMALKPDVILFDEPTSALDPELSVEVLSAIKGVAQTGITMLIVTHEMSFARRVASRVIYMDGGTIVEDGTPEVIFRNPKEARTRQFLDKIYQEFAYAI